MKSSLAQPVYQPQPGGQVKPPQWYRRVSLLTAMAMILGWLGPLYCMMGGSLETNYSPERIETLFVYEANWPGRLLIALGAACFIMAGLLSQARQRGFRLGQAARIGLWALLACSLFWFLWIVNPADLKTSLNITYTPLMWFMVIGIFVAFGLPISQDVDMVVLSIAVLSAGHALWAYHADTLIAMAGGSPLYTSFVTAFWTLAYCVAAPGALLNRVRSFLWVPLLVLAYLAIVVGMRGWSIQIGFLAVMLVAMSHRRQSLPYYVGGGLAAICLVAWVMHVQPGLLDRFFERLGADTRSHQYQDLFLRVDWVGLFRGYGPLATYDSGRTQGYNYIDNQVLYVLFKFGAVTLIGYVLVILLPAVRVLFLPVPWRVRALAVVPVLWLLAMVGVSTFSAITMNTANYVLILTAGHCHSILWRHQSTRGRGGRRLAWIQNAVRMGGRGSSGRKEGRVVPSRTAKPIC